MKVTNKLAKELRTFINTAKRKTNVVDNQLIDSEGRLPYIIYMTDKEIGYRFTFTVEDKLKNLLQKDDPKIVSYCEVDDELFEIFKQVHYHEIDMDEYVDKTVSYITNNMVTRSDAREIIYNRRKQRRSNAV